MEAARLVFATRGLPMLEEHFPQYVGRVAGGLVGEGSECFGFDDELSRDHDWQPGFCLWLTEKDHHTVAHAMQREYRNEIHQIRNGNVPSGEASTRRGVFATGAFFHRFLHRNTPPEKAVEWMNLPEEYLAVCTNGEVFYDPLGEFSAFRERLQGHYPRDVRLKKIAARCVTLAQDGQYNFPRSLERGETVAANHALARFIHAACSLVHLLHRRYKPFYKWMHRSLKDLPDPGPLVADHLQQLVETRTGDREDEYRERRDRVEMIAEILAGALMENDISDSGSTFLLKHAAVIGERIEDPAIRRLPLGTG